MRVFIQIASYRDPQLLPTIKDALEKAAHPARLRFGICRQYHPGDGFDDLSSYKDDNRFRIVEIPSQLSRGACWARSVAQRQFRGEAYMLQIDSHVRLVPAWDKRMIDMLETQKRRGSRKPLLTGYVPGFEPGKEGRLNDSEPPLVTEFDYVSPEGLVMLKPGAMLNW